MFQIGSSKTTTTPAYPDYVEGPMKNYYGALGGSGMLSGMEGWSGSVAPLTDQQKRGVGMAGSIADASGRDFSGGILSQASGYKPTQITGESIVDMMNPYLERVGASTMREIGRSYDDASAMAGARAASGVAQPGSGSALALQRAQMARGEGEQKQDAINGILSQGWDRGANLAAQNAQIANQAGQFNASQGLQAHMGADAAYNNYINRMQQGMTGMLSAGEIERSYDQAQRDLPWTNYSRYGSALQGAPAGQTTETPINFNPIAALGSLFSLPF